MNCEPTTLYLIRHAQSHQSAKTDFTRWPLSEKGQEQARELVRSLEKLGLEKIYSSPFLRCQQTVAPFIAAHGVPIELHEELRECLIAGGVVHGFARVWEQAWDDFSFALPECESAGAAQARFLRALTEVAERHPGATLGISTHGMVIGLFLNAIEVGFQRSQAEGIRNPEIVKLTYANGRFRRETAYVCEHLDAVATHHRETPVEF